jgi:hypothetical protein
MNAELSKSNQRLLTLILILLSIPVLYKMYELFIIEGRLSAAKIELSRIPSFLELSLSILLIVLLTRRRFGVLLFTIVTASSECIRLLFSFQYFNELTIKFWIFQLINLTSLVLMILLLKRENNRFFNLEFKAKPTGFEKTYRLISAFNLTFLITFCLEFGIGIGFAIYYMQFQPTTLFTSSFALFLVMMVLTFVGRVQKTKIANLAFLLIASILLNTFLGSSYILLAPFTENWNNAGIDMFFVLLMDIQFLTFGIFMFYIIRTYFKEKAELNNQSGSVSNPNSQLLDAL